jgi:hypothetical protein
MATDWIILDVTSALKSNAMPGTDDSNQYNKARLSQQACAISSETSSRLNCWNVDGAYFNFLCTIVMEEGRQKSKRPSYTAKFKRVLIRCTEEKWNAKLLQFLELINATFDCGGNATQRSAGVRRHEGNSVDPRKDNFLKLMMQSSCFFKRDTRLDCLWVIIYFARRQFRRPNFRTFLEVVS